MFSISIRSGFDRGGLYHLGMGTGVRNGGAGAVNPDEFYVHKPTWRQAVRQMSYAAPWGRKNRMVYAATGARRSK